MRVRRRAVGWIPLCLPPDVRGCRAKRIPLLDTETPSQTRRRRRAPRHGRTVRSPTPVRLVFAGNAASLAGVLYAATRRNPDREGTVRSRRKTGELGMAE